MIYITQLIFIEAGREELFHQFEDIVIPLIPKYNGKLLIRVRPTDESIIESSIEKPYEIHLVQFDSEKELENFTKDEERARFLYLKKESVKSILLIIGSSPAT